MEDISGTVIHERTRCFVPIIMICQRTQDNVVEFSHLCLHLFHDLRRTYTIMSKISSDVGTFSPAVVVPPAADPEGRSELFQAVAPHENLASRDVGAAFWALNTWKLDHHLRRKNKALRGKLRGLAETVAHIGGGGSGEGASADGASADDSSPVAEASTAVREEEEASAQMRAEILQLKEQNSELQDQIRQAEATVDKVLPFLESSTKLRKDVLSALHSARCRLLEDSGAFCFYGGDDDALTQKYLDLEAIARWRSKLAGEPGQEEVDRSSTPEDEDIQPEIANVFRYRPLAEPNGFQIPRVDWNKISTLEFLRDFVGPKRPCIFTNVVPPDEGSQHPFERLRAQAHNITADITVTPNGLADAVRCVPVVGGGADKPVTLFVEPLHAEQVPFADFITLLNNCSQAGEERLSPDNLPGLSEATKSKLPVHGVVVPYLSVQNDNLRQDEGLKGRLDVGFMDPVLAMGREAFSGDPEALNLWVGNAASVRGVGGHLLSTF